MNPFEQRISMLCLVLAVAVTSMARGQGKIYWADVRGEKIRRAQLDGSDVEDVVVNLVETPHGIALDLNGGKMYWCDVTAQKIRRANLDGSVVEDLVTEGPEYPRGIVLDPDHGRMYWVNRAYQSSKFWIQRANLDGSDVEGFLTYEDQNPRGIALDLDAEKIYWIDSYSGTIKRSDLDGSEIKDVVTEAVRDSDAVVVDSIHGKIYWSGYERGARSAFVRRANLDGSDVEYLITESGDACAIAIDAQVGVIYWANYHAIYRAHLDGTTVEQIASLEVGAGCGVALDVESGAVYWTGSNSIQRATLDGTEPDALITGTVNRVLTSPGGLAVDSFGRKMYWTDYIGLGQTFFIRSANLDGSGIEEPVPDTPSAGPIATDPRRGKVYWVSAEREDGGWILQRANLDGSQIEPLIRTDAGCVVTSIAVDVDAGKVYWAVWACSPAIARANLDGTQVEAVVVGWQLPPAVGVEPHIGKVYWTDAWTGSIRRANLDGSEVEDVIVDNVCSPAALALDHRHRRMYWTCVSTDLTRIRSADLDGTGVEEVVNMPESAIRIALDLFEVASTELDVRPGSCPNPLNVRGRGVVQMALVGAEAFDVTDVDTDSIILDRADGVGAEVQPLPWRPGHTGVVRDVVSPFDGPPCECHHRGKDGIDDLIMRFSTRQMVRAFELNSALHGDEIELVMSGQLFDGREFTASDCITIVGRPGSAGLRGTRGPK